jgi:hypothetical protein
VALGQAARVAQQHRQRALVDALDQATDSAHEFGVVEFGGAQAQARLFLARHQRRCIRRRLALRIPVAALQRLLRGKKALLQRRLRTQVVADGQRRALRAQPRGAVGHRRRPADRQRMVQLAPPRLPGGRDLTQHLFDLVARIGTHGVPPVAADPATGRDRVRIVLRQVDDAAVAIDDEGDVAGQRDKSVGEFERPGREHLQVRRGLAAA